MSHLDYDVLWAHGGDERPNPAVQAHLNQCTECQEALANIQLARHAVQSLPEVPPMPESMARRVGHALSQAADAQAAKAFAPWWQSLFTFRFALVSAVAVVLVGFGAWLLAAFSEKGFHDWIQFVDLIIISTGSGFSEPPLECNNGHTVFFETWIPQIKFVERKAGAAV